MKTLKFKIVSENTNTMILQVVEQSHRGDGFGGNNDNVWLASNSVRLASATQPAYYEPWDQCYVRGYYESCDDNAITVAHAIGLRILEAAAEYNRVFGDKDEPAAVKSATPTPPNEWHGFRIGDTVQHTAGFKGVVVAFSVVGSFVILRAPALVCGDSAAEVSSQADRPLDPDGAYYRAFPERLTCISEATSVAANRATAHPHESGPGLAVHRGIGRCECGAYPFGKCSRCGRVDYRMESVTRETNRRMR